MKAVNRAERSSAVGTVDRSGRPPLADLPVRLDGLIDRGLVPAVAGGLAIAFIALGILGARALGGDFPVVVFISALATAFVGVFVPYIAVLGAIVVSPTFGWATLGPDISPFQVLIAGAVLGCIPQLRSVELLRRLARSPEVVLASAFVAFLVLAAAVRRGSTDWAFVRNYVGALAFLGACAVTLSTPRRRRYALGALAIGCAATAVVGLVQLRTTDALVAAWVLPAVELVQDTYERLGSPWGLSNVGSDYGKDVLVGLLVTVPFALGRRSAWQRAAMLGALLVLVTALVMSGSRSAWLGAAAALLYFAFTSRRLTTVVAFVALTGLFAALIFRPATPVDVQVAVGLPEQEYRAGAVPSPRSDTPDHSSSPRLVIGGTRDEVSTEVSNNLRRRLTVAGLEMVRDQPVFGVGAGAFKSYVDSYEPVADSDDAVDTRRNLPAHNVVIEIWAGSGTPAALLYLALVAAVFLRLHRSRSREGAIDLYAGAAAALLALFTTSLFHNYQYDNLIWLLCGLAAAVSVWGARGVPAGNAESPSVQRALR